MNLLCITHITRCDIFDSITYTGTAMKYAATGFGALFGFRACQKLVESAKLAATALRPELSTSYAVELPVNVASSPFVFCTGIRHGFISANLLFVAVVLHKLGF